MAGVLVKLDLKSVMLKVSDCVAEGFIIGYGWIQYRQCDAQSKFHFLMQPTYCT